MQDKPQINPPNDANKTANIEVIPPETKQKKKSMAAKTLLAMGLVNERGMDPKKALIMASGNADITNEAVRVFKKKLEKWSIMQPSTQKIAHKALASFAAGRDVNGIEPKSIDVRAAAERIIDQCSPVVRQVQNLNVNMDICPVDLSRYLN